MAAKIRLRKAAAQSYIQQLPDRETLIATLGSMNLAWGDVRDVEDIQSQPTVKHRGTIVQVDNKEGGTRPVVQSILPRRSMCPSTRLKRSTGRPPPASGCFCVSLPARYGKTRSRRASSAGSITCTATMSCLTLDARAFSPKSSQIKSESMNTSDRRLTFLTSRSNAAAGSVRRPRGWQNRISRISRSACGDPFFGGR